MHLIHAQEAVAAHSLEVGLQHMVANLFQGGVTSHHLGHVGVGAGRLDQGLVEQLVGQLALLVGVGLDDRGVVGAVDRGQLLRAVLLIQRAGHRGGCRRHSRCPGHRSGRAHRTPARIGQSGGQLQGFLEGLRRKQVGGGVGRQIGLAAVAIQQGQTRLGAVMAQDHHPRLAPPQLLPVGHGLQAGEFDQAGADHHGNDVWRKTT